MSIGPATEANSPARGLLPWGFLLQSLAPGYFPCTACHLHGPMHKRVAPAPRTSPVSHARPATTRLRRFLLAPLCLTTTHGSHTWRTQACTLSDHVTSLAASHHHGLFHVDQLPPRALCFSRRAGTPCPLSFTLPAQTQAPMHPHVMAACRLHPTRAYTHLSTH